MNECTAIALVGCQNDDCAAEVSYRLSMLRWWRDGPICEVCYEQEWMPEEDAERPDWSTLDPIKIDQLRAD